MKNMDIKLPPFVVKYIVFITII